MIHTSIILKIQKKHLTKSNTLYVINALQKLQIKNNFPNLIKGIYKNPSANMIKDVPKKTCTRLLLPPIGNTVLKVVTVLVKATREIYKKEYILERKKTSLFADDTGLYTKIRKPHKKLLGITKRQVSKVASYKMNIQN